MEPLHLTQYALAKAIAVAPIRIARSHAANAPSPPIPPCACRVTLAHEQIGGSISNLHYDLELAIDNLEARINRTIKPRLMKSVA